MVLGVFSAMTAAVRPAQAGRTLIRKGAGDSLSSPGLRVKG